MPLHSDSYYRNLVDDYLRQTGLLEPPVELAAVADGMGVPVRDVVFPAWFTGAILVEDGMPLLLMNATSSETGRRSALGHMLGHVLMRLDDATTPYPRDTNEDHHLADMMAEEFILPEFMVRDQAAKWFNDFRYLARLFGVPENDMMERMRELGIIKSRGILWDY